MRLPILTKNGNEYLDTHDNKSYAYNLKPIDTEHLTFDELENYFKGVAQDLSQMSEDGAFLKIYFKDGKTYANSTSPDLAMTDISVEKNNGLLQELLGPEITSSNILNRGDHLKTGGQFLRFIRLREFPQEIADQGHFNHLGNFLMAIRRVSPGDASSRLDQKRRVLRTHNSGEFANYRSEEGEEQAEELLAKIQLGEDCLYEVEFWFWILADSYDELQGDTRRILEHFKHFDGSVSIEDLGLSEAFLNFVPGVAASFVNALILPTSYLLGIMPLSADYLHKQGVPLSSLSDRPVYFDSFDGDNCNIAIVGGSGSGKSFLTQKIVDFNLSQGKKAVILDRGGSFKLLAEYHNGTFFDGQINPLQFKNPLFLTEFISSFIPHEEFTHKDKCLLFKIIKERAGETTKLLELLAIIDTQIAGLSLYFEQFQDYFTDDPVQFTDISYVDTRNYPDSFLRPLFVYLSEYVKNLDGQKLFVFEECWYALRHNIGHLGEFFRTSRAQGISCIAVTQLLDDLTQSDLGKVIAENTFFKIVFSSRFSSSEYFDSDDRDRINLLSSKSGQFTEFYFKTPFHRKTLRYYPTAIEHELFTSNYEDKKQIEKYISDHQDYLDLQTIMKRWVEVKYGQENTYTPLADI